MSEQRLIRAFIAIQAPGKIREALGRLIEHVRECVPPRSVRWVRVENIHLTLRFIGGVPEQEIERVTSALQVPVLGLHPFELQAGRLDCLPNRKHPRVLWIGLGGAMNALAELQVRVQDATSPWGRPETREFHPHLTVGRVNTNRRHELEAISQALQTCSNEQCPSWTVEAIHLMQSVTTSGGSHYTTLASLLLAD